MKPLAKQPLLLFAVLILGLSGLFFHVWKEKEASPIASINLSKTKEQILQQARQVAREHGYDTKDAVEATIFSCDEATKTFLEYNLGLAKANHLMRDKLPVWYWYTRFCRPLKFEEFCTYIAPDGKLIGFEHIIENDRALPSVPSEKAKEIARDFGIKQAKIPLENWNLFEEESEPRLKRTDYKFTWSNRKEDFHGAGEMVEIQVSGAEVVQFRRYVGTPEYWDKEYRNLRSYNEAFQSVADILHLILAVVAVAVAFWAMAKKLFKWRFALPVATVIGLLNLADSLNNVPEQLVQYNSSMPLQGYLLDVYAQAVWTALCTAVEVLAVTGAGALLYTKAFPERVRLDVLLRGSILRSRQFIDAIIAGYGSFGVHMGWLTLYYLVGRNFGFFSPLGWDETKILSSAHCVINATFIGAVASVTEEFMYRVVALCLLQRLVKNFWLANFLQAAAWAFGHCNYPQEPPYVRGVELTPIGMFYGWIMRRYGLLAPLVSHYMTNTFLGVYPMLQSTLLSFRIPGYLPLLPLALLAIAGIVQIRRQGILSHKEEEEAEQPGEAVAASYAHHWSLTLRPQMNKLSVRCGLAIFVVAALATVLTVFPLRAGQGVVLTIGRDAAIDKARDYLVQHKNIPQIPVASAKLDCGLDENELQYLLENSSLQKTCELARDRCLYWHVRFCKPMETSQTYVSIDSTGAVISPWLYYSSEATGAALKEAQAKQVLDNYLRLEHPEFVPYELLGVTTTHWTDRTDYGFTLKVPKYTVKEAYLRLKIDEIGDRIGGLSWQWILPDRWLWQHQQSESNKQLFSYVITICGVILGLAALWWLIGIIRAHVIPWKATIVVALALTALATISKINQLPLFFWNYDIDDSLFSYTVLESAQGSANLLVTFVFLALITMSGFGAFKLFFPTTRLKEALLQPTRDAGLWLDGVLAGYGCGIGYDATYVWYAYFQSLLSNEIQQCPLTQFCDLINTFSPATDVASSALMSGAVAVLLVPALFALYACYLKSVKRLSLFAGVLVLGAPLTASSLGDYAAGVFLYMSWLVLAWLLISKLGRFNAVAFFFAGFSSVVATQLRNLMVYTPNLFPWDIRLVGLLLVSPFIYYAYLRFRHVRR